MGHRSSKLSPNSPKVTYSSEAAPQSTAARGSESNQYPLLATAAINFQGPSSFEASSSSFPLCNTNERNSNSLSLPTNRKISRQIIIKIQLAKMENESEATNHRANSSENLRSSPQILNLTLNRSYLVQENTLDDEFTAQMSGAAGSSGRSGGAANEFENGGTAGCSVDETGSIKLEVPEYCEVLEEKLTNDTYTHMSAQDKDNCCRRKSKMSILPVSSKRRCCKCTCRDALRRILEPSSKSIKNKERKDAPHSSNAENQQRKLKTAEIKGPIVAAAANPLSLWTPNTLAPINPQLVVVCPGSVNDADLHILTTQMLQGIERASINTSTPTLPEISSVRSQTLQQKVHSQVDYTHCLVPDLDRILNSSFYWGEMDRYEAERLLDGKPEGTFLLRDSAQEEFLFSVTFRKYGRSLHARIEQSGHKFSFDCHDPCVFTARTVTGLLEHYKDPSCVMFFEPMLTIPLHRTTTFSLQQLCRAKIASQTTYDGVNELELPVRLKSYLKEYHYKQKLRVKPFDEPF